MEAAAMAHRSAFLRLGGGMLVVGPIAWLVLSGLHGELPSTGQAAVEHVHTVVSIAIVAAGLGLVTGTLADPWAAAFARAGTMIVVPSAAVLSVGFAIDGFVLAALADGYAPTADQAVRAMDAQRADAVVMIIGGHLVRLPDGVRPGRGDPRQRNARITGWPGGAGALRSSCNGREPRCRRCESRAEVPCCNARLERKPQCWRGSGA